MRRVGMYIGVVLLAVVAFAMCADLFVIVATDASTYRDASAVPKETVALVLGASIRSTGQLSPVLQERADAAVALYRARKVDKILVSGDNSTLQYDEVYPVGKYLLSQGIPQDDIFLDYAGFDTYSSMYRAKYIFGVSSMTIVSQRFHLPRALFIAHALGMSAVGLDAGAPGERYFENTLREIPATSKALYDVVVHRVPQYLGQQFFVTGPSDATWVGPKTEMIYFIGAKQYGQN